MALGEPFTGNAVTVGSTELSLTNSTTTIATQTTDCVVSLWLDCTNMTAADEFEVALYEKVISAGTQRKIVLASILGAQPWPFLTGCFQLHHGWDFSLKKIAGTDRAFTWSIRNVT